MNNLSEKIKLLIEHSGIYQSDRNQLHTDIMQAIEDSYSGDMLFVCKSLEKLTQIKAGDIIQIDKKEITYNAPVIEDGQNYKDII